MKFFFQLFYNYLSQCLAYNIEMILYHFEFYCNRLNRTLKSKTLVASYFCIFTKFMINILVIFFIFVGQVCCCFYLLAGCFFSFLCIVDTHYIAFVHIFLPTHQQKTLTKGFFFIRLKKVNSFSTRNVFL